MKKIILIIAMLLTVVALKGQTSETQLKTIAIFTTGNASESAQKFLATELRGTLLKTGKYIVAAREAQFIELLKQEEKYQQGGRVADNKQLENWAAQFGVEVLCTGEMNAGDGLTQSSAVLLDIKANRFISQTEIEYGYSSNLVGKDLLNLCKAVANNLTQSIGGSITQNTASSSSSNPVVSVNINQDYVVIEGIRWATCNVGSTPRKFAANPKIGGGLYTYEEAKNACPSGWRLPDKDELDLLITAGSRWTDKGREFGSGSSVIFLPAAGSRSYSDGSLLYVGTHGDYWSSTPNGSEYAYYLFFYSSNAGTYYTNRKYGQSVRCVAE
ncbi:hypothetical protein FACS1894178_7610 [Bacteroidia bacterium]|nr:hypothetical protein FACS1894178_7610 [Bacteroidia bacterium]